MSWAPVCCDGFGASRTWKYFQLDSMMTDNSLEKEQYALGNIQAMFINLKILIFSLLSTL